MGNFFLCRALVLLTENLYWTISILNDDFGTKCSKVVIFFGTHLSLFVTVGLPVNQVPASVLVQIATSRRNTGIYQYALLVLSTVRLELSCNSVLVTYYSIYHRQISRLAFLLLVYCICTILSNVRVLSVSLKMDLYQHNLILYPSLVVDLDYSLQSYTYNTSTVVLL